MTYDWHLYCTYIWFFKISCVQSICSPVQFHQTSLILCRTSAYGGLAQMVERSLSMWEVPGSIPGFSKHFFNCFDLISSWMKSTYEKHMYSLLWTHQQQGMLGRWYAISLTFCIRQTITASVCVYECGYVSRKISEPARIRTWNLLIRSQTRYPLRHRSSWKKPS